MKARFYCDLPPYKMDAYHLYASTTPPNSTIPDGWKRVAFDVDFPPEVFREYDLKAPVEFKGEI